MRTVHKFPLKDTINHVEMPVNAKFLSLQVQGDTPVMWYEVETTNVKSVRCYTVFDTGEILPANAQEFVGTYQVGSYVGHVYHIYD